jgi:transposase InsO family protein
MEFDMADRTVTRAIETDVEADVILAILKDPRLIPRWAPAFADTVEVDTKNGWRVVKDDAAFSLELVISPSSRTVDYLREIAPGKRGGAYIRVLQRPGGGSVVVMTLPVAGGANVEAVTNVLTQELKRLVALSETASS